MIKGLIISSSTGINLFNKSYGYHSDNEILGENIHLINSFLVANETFSSKMMGKNVYIIRMTDDTQFIFERDEKNKLLIILLSDTRHHLFNLQQKLKHIKFAFLYKFPEICLQFNHTLKGKYYRIPKKEIVEEIIDQIILNSPSGGIEEIFSLFNTKNISKIFSSLLSKRNIIVFGNDEQIVKKFTSSLPLLVPFREFYITDKILKVENIGVLIPFIENITEFPKNCWWIVGTNTNYVDFDESITFIDIDKREIYNEINPSYYELAICEQLNKNKEPQIIQSILSNKLTDLINTVSNLRELEEINEEILVENKLKIYLLPIIKKIIKNDFLAEDEIEIKEDYFDYKLSRFFG
ncbi:MAG: hypothetical protein HWN67_14215 [Candidatus Helarchaeota archaeon]|nr:hypothetical protein [Candidatus Helarchaeota archaeon]